MKIAYMPDTHGGPYNQPEPTRDEAARFCDQLLNERELGLPLFHETVNHGVRHGTLPGSLEADGGPVGCSCLLPGAGGSAGAGSGGGPLLVRHGPRLLPAGRALLLARPGRPVSPGRLDDGRVKGGRRPVRRTAQRP